MKKDIHKLAAVAALPLLGLATASAASVSLGTATPDAGDGVSFIATSTSDADNTAHSYVPNDYVGNGNGLNVGQSFTTGANAGGYLLDSISVRQVSWASDYDYTGGNVTIRLFDSSGGFFPSVLLTQQVAAVDPGAGGDVVIGGTPASPMWLTFSFDSPIALDANKLYAFVFSSDGTNGNDGFFMNLDGVNSDSYAGGSSITEDNTANLWSGGVDDGAGGGPSERTFVASMSFVPEPSSALLGGLGLLGLLRRRR